MDDFISQAQCDESFPLESWPPCECSAGVVCDFCQYQDQAELDYLNNVLLENANFLQAEPDERDEQNLLLMMLEN
jgi:hypothetical protein